MHWDFLITNLMNGLIALVLLLVGYKTFDLVLYKVNFSKKLNENNISVAIIIVAIFIGLSIVISTAAY